MPETSWKEPEPNSLPGLVPSPIGLCGGHRRCRARV